jgi:bifunctional non-homologous end joining protein LigD
MRCPHGMLEQCFYQRHIAEGLPEHVRAVPVPGMTEPEGFLVVDGLTGILELVQLGALEFHTWGACVDEPDSPDTLVFDLDPGPGVTMSDVMDAARLVRMRVESLGLAAFVKTTGGKGLHVVVPIAPDLTWKPAEEFARALAEEVARVAPSRYTTNMRKDRRDGAIFIDYVRNTKSSSSVAPYSTRARAGGPVALPVAWDALDDALAPSAFGVERARAVLDTPDPWAEFDARRRPVSAQMRGSLGLEA